MPNLRRLSILLPAAGLLLTNSAAFLNASGPSTEAAPVPAIGFLAPSRPRAAAPVPAPAPMAPVLDLRAFAGRRSA